jgi:hypothetical protein
MFFFLSYPTGVGIWPSNILRPLTSLSFPLRSQSSIIHAYKSCVVDMVSYITYQLTNEPTSQPTRALRQTFPHNFPTSGEVFVSVARTNMAPIIWSTEFLPKNNFFLQMFVHVFAFRMCRFLVSLISNIRERISLPVCKEGIAVLPRGARCVWSRPPAHLHGSLYIAWKAARFPKLRVLLL